jgi:2-keto-4-pentenoate hydratase/2-oxohepta-3-ene-1,7-dioic acid hydratase in catechol pathway
MKFANFEHGQKTSQGIIKGDFIIKLESFRALRALGASSWADLLSLVQCMEDSLLENLKNETKSISRERLLDMEKDGKAYRLEAVRLKTPMRPAAIFCLGFNYRSHAPELNRPVPEVPVIFMKPSAVAVGPDDEVVMPRAAERVDYEVELAIVIGKKGRYISRDKAYDHVFGYTILNDITARDVQRRDFSLARPWLRSKSFDTFAPIGPWLVTSDEAGDPMNLELSLKVNGETRQHANTREMIFDIPSIIEYISSFTTLEPGALIATGTPENIGPLKDGDLMEAGIEKIGVLRNRSRKE